MNKVAKFDQHHQKRQQHHIHHAPLADVFHDVQCRGFVPLMQEFEQAEFEQQHNLCQRKNDRKQQYDPTNQPVTMFQEFNGSAENTRLLSDAELFNLQDRTQDTAGQNKDKRSNSRRSRPTGRLSDDNLAAGRQIHIGCIRRD